MGDGGRPARQGRWIRPGQGWPLSAVTPSVTWTTPRTTDEQRQAVMTDPTAPESSTQASTAETSETDLVEESLVEEISIDGMCGVY